jgi:hypothetical protein
MTTVKIVWKIGVATTVVKNRKEGDFGDPAISTSEADPTFSPGIARRRSRWEEKEDFPRFLRE